MYRSIVFVGLSVVEALQWSRRVYYNDTSCTVPSAQPVFAASVTTLFGTCNGVAITNTCSVRSTTEPLLSSEASGCGAALDSGFSDAIWIPTGASPNSVYLSLNSFTSTTACLSVDINEQDTYLADGACHAVERSQSFFVASCNGTAGSLKVCSDPQCTACGSDLRAAVYGKTDWSGRIGECAIVRGQYMMGVCTTAGSPSIDGSKNGQVAGAASTTSAAATTTSQSQSQAVTSDAFRMTEWTLFLSWALALRIL
ncbi:hypothetical protein HDU91_007055 [Kappamyces sp. JEL0680]|nr:hypothetical protein HDU91_007055 [Kappamyces sp. JEL0680]